MKDAFAVRSNPFRRASAWSTHGPDAARAAGDYLFSRAFAELAATGDAEAVSVLARATLCLARGEALQRSQTNDPDTSVESYLARKWRQTRQGGRIVARDVVGPERGEEEAWLLLDERDGGNEDEHDHCHDEGADNPCHEDAIIGSPAARSG